MTVVLAENSPPYPPPHQTLIICANDLIGPVIASKEVICEVVDTGGRLECENALMDALNQLQ